MNSKKILEKLESIEISLQARETIQIFGYPALELLTILISSALLLGALLPAIFVYFQNAANNSQREIIKSEFDERVEKSVKNGIEKYVTNKVEKIVSSELARHFELETRKYSTTIHLINLIINKYSANGKFKSNIERNRVLCDISSTLYQFLNYEDADVTDALMKIKDLDDVSKEGFSKVALLKLLKHLYYTGLIKDDQTLIAENIAKKCGGKLYSE